MMIQTVESTHLKSAEERTQAQRSTKTTPVVHAPHAATARQDRHPCSYVVTTNEPERWAEVLQRCTTYDMYHLAGYHQLTEEQDGHRAELFVFEEGDALAAMPFVLRPLADIPGLDGADGWDATSVYGYAGPIFNRPQPEEKTVQRFAAALQTYFVNRGIVSAFSRLHPIMDEQAAYLSLAGGEVLDVGPTVAVDLTLSPEEQWHHVRADHRRAISKARRAGIQCVRDETGRYFDDFIDIYYQTMQRVGATGGYFFDRQYFYRLREVLGDRLHLFVALKDEVVTAGSLFTTYNSIIQYHLSGTHDDYLKVAPSKFILDGVRQWGSEMGEHILHLGGGVGAQEDSLFRFKAGFSRLTRRFKVWRMVSDAERYNALVEQRRRWSADNGYAAPNAHFFPTYRCPVAAK